MYGISVFSTASPPVRAAERVSVRFLPFSACIGDISRSAKRQRLSAGAIRPPARTLFPAASADNAAAAADDETEQLSCIVGIDLGTSNSVVALIEGDEPVAVPSTAGTGPIMPSVVAFCPDGKVLVGQVRKLAILSYLVPLIFLWVSAAWSPHYTQTAKHQAALNPRNTFYSVKRFIGRQLREVTEDAARMAYSVTSDDEGNSVLECDASESGETCKACGCRQCQRHVAAPPRPAAAANRVCCSSKPFCDSTPPGVVYPEEVSACVVGQLLEDAAAFAGRSIARAVISVPAYFSNAQREATAAAGQLAGLESVRIIREPVAAALAYGLDAQEDQTVLVFDLGGGTYDVSLLEVWQWTGSHVLQELAVLRLVMQVAQSPGRQATPLAHIFTTLRTCLPTLLSQQVGGGVIEVLSTGGDAALGGDDWDAAIVEWLVVSRRAAPSQLLAADAVSPVVAQACLFPLSIMCSVHILHNK